jgi:Zn-dependent peptidase ImmA (M78 family)
VTIKKVPYLTEDQIERDAASLLAEYERVNGIQIGRTVPIEDIVEKYLKLGMEFDDLHRLLGVPRSGSGPESEILGAMFFDERRVVVDQSLDPEENPAKEGRYRFTLAHEGGHWRLHRHLFDNATAQISFLNEAVAPSVVCRSSQAKERIERQADMYASCLLMPSKLIAAAWNEMFPDARSRVVQTPFAEVAPVTCQMGNLSYSENDEDVLNRIARPFAEQFLVSPIAMRIRLERLGLLQREVPDQYILNLGA